MSTQFQILSVVLVGESDRFFNERESGKIRSMAQAGVIIDGLMNGADQKIAIVHATIPPPLQSDVSAAAHRIYIPGAYLTVWWSS